jgi:hypothetical protein
MGRNLFWRSAVVFWLIGAPLGAQESIPSNAWPWGQTPVSESEEESDQEAELPAHISLGVDEGEKEQAEVPPNVAWQSEFIIPDHPQISYYERLFLPGGNGYQHLKTTLERGKPFLSFIHQKAIEYGVPTELMWLPVIESSFIGKAGSRAGARGLWQFMLNSISRDMTVDIWRDDRLDFWLATEAAFHKLKTNYNILGDWALALAAYNAGLGRIRSLFRIYAEDYWTLLAKGRLPRETAQYVPKFYALLKVMRTAHRHGLDFGWEMPEGMEDWIRIPMENKQVDISLLASHAGLPAASLRAWNLELLNRVTPPRILLPQSSSEVRGETPNGPVEPFFGLHALLSLRGSARRHYLRTCGILWYSSRLVKPI